MGSCFSTPPQGSDQPTSSTKTKGASPRINRRDREEQLHRIPGRLFLNGSSDVASLFTQQGKKGTNQDAMLVWENFGSRTDTVFCGVFDGHGPYGHMVARKVRDSLPLKLKAQWEVSTKSNEASFNTSGSPSLLLPADEEATPFIDGEETEKNLEVFQTLKESFLKAFKVMDRELRMYANVDCFCSGTTAVTLVKQGHDLVIGNVGDSRAVLALRGEDNMLTAVQLTVDLKPNLPAEEERIRKCKGRVFALRDEPDVARVWLPNNDSPGLAMARAFGDFCLKDFGLISVPEVSYRRIADNDEFIVLATDGIWDVLTNKEVVDIVDSCATRSYAARTLVESAVRAWRSKYPTSKVDDCAVICLFLDSNESNASAMKSEEKSSMNPSPKKNSNIPPSSDDEDDNDHASAATGLKRSGTVRGGNEEESASEDAITDDEHMISTEAGEEWSALEGVSRLNTLMTLPRFFPGEDDEKARARK